MVHHRTLNIVSCAIQYDLVVHPSYIPWFVFANHTLPVLLPFPCLPLGNYKSVLYICEPVSVFQISSFVSYFRFYIEGISYGVCLSLSDLLHLV